MMARKQSRKSSASAAPKRVRIYARVSTDEQRINGLSMEMQVEVCREWCQRNLLEGPYTVEVNEDPGFSGAYGWEPGPTGRRRIRPGLAKLVQDIEAGEVDLAIVYRLDRLARSVRIWAEFAERFIATGRVRFVSVTEAFNFATTEGQLLASVLSAVAGFQRAVVADNVRNTILKRTSEGLPWGTPGYGWKRITRAERQPGEPPRIEVVPEEAEQVLRILGWYMSGWGRARIARTLQREGVPPPSGGKQWLKMSVQHIIENPLHAGRVRHDGGLIPGQHFDQRIIEPEYYDRIMAEVERRHREGRHFDHGEPFALWKVARCLRCGSLVQGFTPQRRGWNPTYTCRGSEWDAGETCIHWQKSAALVERVVLKHIAAFAARPDFQALVDAAAREKVMEMEVGRLEERAGQMEKALADLGRQQRRLLTVYTTGHCPEEDYLEENARIEDDRRTLQQELDGVRRILFNEAEREGLLEQVKRAVQHIPEIWGELNHEERRHLLASLLEYIRLGPAPDGRFMLVMKIHFLPEVTEELIHGKSRETGLFDTVAGLTKRELALLYWVREGKSLAEVAEMWRQTIQAPFYLAASIKRRLGVSTLEEAVVLAAHRLDEEKDTLPLGATDWHVGRPKGPGTLTRRMTQAIEDYIEGLSEEACAERRGLSVRTITCHRWHVKHRYGVKTLDEAAQMYLAEGNSGGT